MKGNIILSYDESLPDSVKIALNVAKEMWEAKLQNKRPIYIQAIFEPYDPDVAMMSEVVLVEMPSVGCPSALASQFEDGTVEDPDDLDGMIIFNSEIKWNCNFSGNAVNDYNLTTMALRGIARCLGFGSSIYEEDDNKYRYYHTWPSYFDNMLYSYGDKLSDLEQGSKQMADFIKSDNVFINTVSDKYRIYAPKTYSPHKSLCYLHNNNSIMSHSLSQGNVALSIDNSTVDILKAIGWDLPSTGLSIICSDISNDGIGSSYTPHSFTLSTNIKKITNYSWRFLLKDKFGHLTLISTGSEPIFIIDKIKSSPNYYVNTNGDFEGRIECSYFIDGKEQNAIPFSISLEQKPIITSISNLSINLSDNKKTFSLSFDVNYLGADNIRVEVEEEFNTSVRTYDFYEPFIAHTKTGEITSLYYSWVTAIATNKYGESYETLEFEPTSHHTERVNSATENGLMKSPHNNIQVFNLSGLLIYEGSNISFKDSMLRPGIYLKKSTSNDGNVETSKIFIL